MNPSWLSCTNGGRGSALANAATIGPLLCSKTAIDRRVAGNQRNVGGIIRLAVQSLPELPSTFPPQRERPLLKPFWHRSFGRSQVSGVHGAVWKNC